ncbi:class I SAM-dependent methyltransferase [Salipiger sp. P9]|uniref:class I SAM-dependent methyltransferase n=1 Tax=Salipiger pentaromativorans TaxID=2943193 RepID=UPI002158A09C|nr:class I SAM-dependent methyltransferase [Salipiger pentaromativorans]MCR8547090.1 class I SAM-dependent methyltransferase [Salipiger pentaromativorans]
MAETDTAPNAAQEAFWSSGPGQHWVRLHRELDTLHDNLTRIVLEAAQPQPGERVVDIGCGAGAVAIAAGQHVGEAGYVLGLDISAPLIGVGRDRAEAVQICAPDFLVADAQTWAHEGAPFDLCVSRIGLMFFADPIAGFRNILAHLRPGGRLVFAAWAASEHNAWFRIPMELAVARLGPAAPGDPHGPGPTAFADTARVIDLLTEAGAKDISAQTVDTTLEVPEGYKAAAELTQFVGPISRHLRDKGGTDADRAAIHRGVKEAFRRFDDGNGCHIPARVNLFSATRP